jgi:outer membrane protein TolC
MFKIFKNSWALFSGFAITNKIEKSKLEVVKSSLKELEAKRELYQSITTLFANLYSANMTKEALNEAKEAIEKSYKKAKGLYDNGLISQADLFKMEAKKHEIVANISEIDANIKSLKNSIFYLTKQNVAAKKLPKVKFFHSLSDLQKIALTNREDLKALEIELEMAKKDIDLAKSSDYPKVALIGTLERVGDDLSFDGNGYTNKDKSYIGAQASWNLFSGFESKNLKEAAVLKKGAISLFIGDYKEKIKSDISNAYVKLNSLKSILESAKSALQASKSYYKLTKGRYENQLASADELSRAIADVAQKKANLQMVKAKIFMQKASLLLLSSSKTFLNSID